MDLIASYVPFLIFLVLVVAVIFAETRWLAGRGWATKGSAAAFAITTDIAGILVGFFVSFAIVMVMLMLTFGPSGRGGTTGDAVYILLVALAVLLPLIILVGLKRIFLLVLKVGVGRAVWGYSMIASILVLVTVIVPPSVIFYLLTRFG